MNPMTNRDNIFLTENRRDVLKGTSDWEDASIANEKSRIKNRAKLALEELTEVAESGHIDNTDIFDADDVGQLLEAILHPGQQHLEPGEADPDDFTMFVSPEKYTDGFENHHNAHLARLGRIVAREQVLQAENEPESSEN